MRDGEAISSSPLWTFRIARTLAPPSFFPFRIIEADRFFLLPVRIKGAMACSLGSSPPPPIVRVRSLSGFFPFLPLTCNLRDKGPLLFSLCNFCRALPPFSYLFSSLSSPSAEEVGSFLFFLPLEYGSAAFFFFPLFPRIGEG